MKTTTDQLRAFVRRGLAAQKAIDRAIADVVDVSDFPPWKRCQLPGCHAWTRGETCPLHRGEEFIAEGPARQGAPGLSEEHPRGSGGSVGGAHPARGRTATAKGSTHHNGGRKRNARKTRHA